MDTQLKPACARHKEKDLETWTPHAKRTVVMSTTATARLL